MAEKNNATCSICGKAYYKCANCKSGVKVTPWKQYCDTAEHYKIFQVIHGFNTGVYTKEEAREKLQLIDLSDLNKLRDNIKKIIKDIMKEDKKQIKSEETTEIVETVVETMVEQPSYTSRRKKYSESVEVEDVVEQ